MDYISQPTSFKIRKALRYIQLYGPRRTLMKIQGQRHQARRYEPLPTPLREPLRGHVGIIGCGNFAYTTIGYYLTKNYGRVIRACMDPDPHRAASFFERYDLGYYTTAADELIADPSLDLIYIASNHASHAEYAIAALRAGKAVHVEKPHCVNEDQLRRLCNAMLAVNGKVRLGFNRPNSSLGRRIRRALLAERGAAMLNWFIAGHQIDPDHWYFAEEEGGRVLGNLCHWTDFIYQMIPPDARFPITIVPTRAQTSDCDIAVGYVFGNGSIASITFSARGHSFEGVRERFAGHKGDTLIFLDDFKTLTIECGADTQTIRLWFRDHGHEEQIRRSYEMSKRGAGGESAAYVWETGILFLKTKEALERNATVVIESSHLPPPAEGGGMQHIRAAGGS
jgi:predicted dehydrogenase